MSFEKERFKCDNSTTFHFQDVSVYDAMASVISEMGGISSLIEKQRMVIKVFLDVKDVFSFSRRASARVLLSYYFIWPLGIPELG